MKKIQPLLLKSFAVIISVLLIFQPVITSVQADTVENTVQIETSQEKEQNKDNEVNLDTGSYAQVLKAASSYGTVQYDGSVSFSGSMSAKFTLKDAKHTSGNVLGFCAEATKEVPDTGTKLQAPTKVTNNKMRKALYYGYGGPAAKLSKTNANWVRTSVALSKANGFSTGTSGNLDFYNDLSNYASPPDSFTVYMCKTVSSCQALCYWTYEPYGYIKVKKTTTNQASLNNTNYSLEGAVFGVYLKPDCMGSSRIGRLTTNAKGESSALKVSLFDASRTFYVKEMTAPKGYVLSNKVHTITVNDTKSVTVHAKNDPVKGKLQLKKSSSDEKSIGRVGYSLSGAVYGVYTNKACTEAYRVKGADLTTNGKGISNTVSLIAKTYYVKEITPPKGYEKNTTVYMVKVTANAAETVLVEAEDTPIYGYGQVQKLSSSTEIPDNGEYSLAGAQFKVYDTYTEGKLTDYMGTLTTDKTGKTGKLKLVAGDYWVKETKAPKNFKLNMGVYKLVIQADESITLIKIENEPLKGKLQLKKSSSTSSTGGNHAYSLVNAVYGVYTNKNCTASSRVTDANLTTKADGTSNIVELWAGDYWVKETTAPKGYGKDTQAHPVTIVTGSTSTIQTLEVEDIPVRGKLKLIKSSSNDATEGNSNYSLENAVYGVYTNKACASSYRVARLTTGANGESNTVSLLANTYYVKEMTAPKGYTKDTAIYEVKVTANSTKVILVEVEDVPVCGYAQIQKVSSNTDLPHTAEYSLAGAQFRVYKNYESGKLSGLQGHLTTDAAGKTSKLKLLAGTYYVKETKAPANFKLNSAVYKISIKANGSTTVLKIADEPLKGKLQLEKSSKVLETENSPYYSLEGAVYGIYTNKACTSADRIANLITKADGISDTAELWAGDYWIKERTAPKGYAVDTKVYPVTITTNTTGKVQLLKVEETPEPGYAYVMKTTSNVKSLDNVHYSLAGAEYTIYTTYKDGSLSGKVGTVKTDEKGSSDKLNLLAGKYYAKESKAPRNYKLNTKIHEFEVQPGKTVVINTTDDPIKGKLRIKKISSKPEVTDGNDRYTVEGIYYRLYRDEACTDRVCQFYIDEDQISGTLTAIAGTYYLKEYKTNSSYILDKNVYTVEILPDETTVVTKVIKDDPVLSNLSLQKTSSVSNTLNNENYSLEGAVYRVFSNAELTQRVGDLTTKADGSTNKLTNLAAGKYYVKEIKASKGYKLDTKTYTVDLSPGEAYELFVKEVPLYGYGQIYKTSADPGLTDGNSSYSVAGAEYTIYRDKACTNKISTWRIGANGYTSRFYYLAGTYYVKETKAPVNYEKNDAVYTLKISTDNTTSNVKVLMVKDMPKAEPAQMLLQKVDSEGNAREPQGGASLAGAEFTIRFFDGTDWGTRNPAENGARVLGQWAFRTNVTGKIIFTDHSDYFISGGLTDTDATFWYNSEGEPILPEGTITIEETKAPKGYIKDENVHVIPIFAGESAETSFENELLIPNDIIKGDLEFTKKDADTDKPLAGVVFEIISKTTNQVVRTLTTDKNGYATTKLNQEPDGSLPFDTYIIREKKPLPGYFPMEEVEVMVSQAGKMVNAGSFENNKAKITTSVLDKDTAGRKALACDANILTDTVAYSHLIEGEEYTLKGWLVDGETGEPLQRKGKTVTVSKKFKPTVSNGKTTVIFQGDFSSFAGKRVVVYEELYHDGVKIAEHKNLQDEKQTIVFRNPEITTMAVCADGNSSLGIPDADVSITDTISYRDLAPGLSYTIRGWLVHAETGKNISGTEQEKTFIPKTENGKISVTYKMDGSNMHGDSVVVFEELYYQDSLIGMHKDIDDENQTITFIQPKVSTSAKALSTGDRISYPDEQVEVKDTVTYQGLVKGLEYCIKGILYDKETKLPVFIKGNPVTASKVFTASDSNGETDVSFSFNASGMEGKPVVIFEELSYKGTKLGQHHDISDLKQTIRFPSVATFAADSHTKRRISHADEEVTITDTVSYENLIVGESYTVKGILMDRASGEAVRINGKEVVSHAVFTAENEIGSAEVSFHFDGSELAGKDVVVFEELYFHENLIAVHKDIDDAKQTIRFPAIETSAQDSDTERRISFADGDVTIVDNVSYKNLIAGEDYLVKGILMDKTTGKKLLVNGEEVASYTVFAAEEEKGNVEVAFTFDGKGLAGKDIVVFEELYLGEHLVAVHRDMDDSRQTISFPILKTYAIDSDTKKGISFADKKVIIRDTVSYENLIAGETYTVKGVLMEKKTGDPVQIDDKEVCSEGVFTAENEKGTAEVTFTFDGSGLAGKDIVVFEELYLGEKLIAVHKEIDDSRQTISFPDLKTHATDSDTNRNISFSDKEVTIRDTVSWKNLIAGQQYTVKGVLMEKESGKPLLIDDKEVRSEGVFTAKEETGTADVIFTFDGRGLAGKEIVVFEELYLGEDLVAVHKDLGDRKQTIRFPALKTSANDSDTERGISFADKEVTIQDTVSYENLIAGEKYTVKGALMEKESGKPLLIDDKEVRSEGIFTAKEEKGTAEVIFTFDGRGLAGKEIVVFEELYLGEHLVAVHRDIEDSRQTISFPDLKTSAYDSDTQKSISYGDKEVTIIDTVSYENLIAGERYKVKGTLMDKASGKELLVNDENVITQTVFTAEEEKGNAEVTFIFDGSSLLGKDIVVFEELYLEETLVAAHKDIEDSRQTISFPKIQTAAKDMETDSRLSMADQSVEIKDTVAYKNLIPGESYTIRGVLMDQDSGEVIMIDEKPVEAETNFIAENAGGDTDVAFQFDGALLAGKSAVVFERLYINDCCIASHEDLGDELQTIHFPKISTEAADGEQGGHQSEADETVTIVDTVTYENLIPNEKYTVRGVLMDRETNQMVLQDTKSIVSEAGFKAEESSGQTEVTFRFDGTDFGGKDIVAFEKLYQDGNCIATHEDIDDEKQKISFVSVNTGTPKTKAPLHWEPPRTGDQAMFTLWILLAVLAGSMLTAVRKKE